MPSKPLSKICEDFIFNYFNRNKSCCCFRFADTHDTFQGRGHGVVLGRAPSDFVVTDFGHTFYAEVKSTTNEKGTTKKLFDQQVARRDKVLKANGDYEYFIYSLALDRWFVTSGESIRNYPTRNWDEFPSTPLSDSINLAWKNR